MSDHGHRRGAGLTRFFRRERATEQGTNTEDRQILIGDGLARDPLRVAVARQTERSPGENRRVLEDLLKIGQRLVFRIRPHHFRWPRVGRTDPRRRSGRAGARASSRSALANGSGFRRTALTTANIAVFAPMPSASVSTATAVKPGDRANHRNA